MKKCTMCKAELSESDVFCWDCGSLVDNGSNLAMGTEYAINPNSIQIKLGAVYYKQNKFNEALEIYSNILKQDPENSYIKEMFTKVQLAQKGKK